MGFYLTMSTEYEIIFQIKEKGYDYVKKRLRPRND